MSQFDRLTVPRSRYTAEQEQLHDFFMQGKGDPSEKEKSVFIRYAFNVRLTVRHRKYRKRG